MSYTGSYLPKSYNFGCPSDENRSAIQNWKRVCHFEMNPLSIGMASCSRIVPQDCSTKHRIHKFVLHKFVYSVYFYYICDQNTLIADSVWQ